jgi:hypothetical protein
VKDGLGAHGADNSHVNGHQLSEGFLAHDLLGEEAVPDPKETADREATRYLSAATQINIDYARNVVDSVLNEQLRALAPTFGVDIPVVVKWAIKALYIRSVRDRLLTVILALQCLFIVVVILWWPWAWVLFLLLCVVAWIVVSWDYHERIHKIVIGKMLHDRFRAEDAPVPTREADRERLDAASRRREGNLVVFSGHDAFVGSGKLLSRRHLLLDVIGTKKAEGSPDRQPAKFTSHDLQTAIVAAFDRDHGLGRSLDNIRVYERLFVNGLHIQHNRQLLPNQLRPPPASVDSTLLREAALNPSPEARTYVCVEMPGWQGQLVVTLFIRAVYAGKLLFVEWTFRVLPPIRAEFRMIDGLYERPRYVQLENSLVSGLRSLVPALLASPIHAFSLWRAPRAARRDQFRHMYAIHRGFVFDYGAARSIREDASGSQRHHYFLARDEGMYVLLAQQTLIQTVGEFLTDHGVDLGQFKDQVKVIFDQSINYNIGDITGSSGIAIGKNSSARVDDSSKGST